MTAPAIRSAMRVRKMKAARGRATLPLPADLAELLPDHILFAPEINETGVLFRPADQVKPQVPDLPNWARPAAGVNGR